MTDFDSWNEIKKKVDVEDNKSKLLPKEGEVWIGMMGKNIGREQNGIGDNFSRPLLVVKKFNNQIFWTIPLSTKQKELDFYYNFVDPSNNSVSLILAQLRLLSIKRFKRKIYRLPDSDFKDIKSHLVKFLT